MPAHSDFDGWIPRTVARELVRIAWHCDAIGAESYLIEYMSELQPDEWRCRSWGTQIVAAAEGARIYPWLVAESTRAMQTRLWKEVHTPRDGALIHVRGNEAIYRGPLLWLPDWIEVSSPKGVILPRYSPLVIPNSLTFVDPRRQAEVRLGAISLHAGPLLQVLRRDVGGLADRAVDQLQKQGLLPAAWSGVSGSAATTKRPGTLESKYEEDLRNRPPRGEEKADRAKQMAERYGWNASTIGTWLARPEIDALWLSLGGKPTSSKMRGSRRVGS